MKFANAFTDRRFGVEIEFVNNRYGMREIATKITEAGIVCCAEGYNHTTRAWWKIVTDSSCGFELVSPPLSGVEGLKQIETVCKILADCGSNVNKNCGLHVHHNASDFTVDTFKNLFNLYVRFERVIDSMMPESRRANKNQYCRSVYRFSDRNTLLSKIKDCSTVTELEQIYHFNRYYKLNLEAYVKHGTIEFRHHSGTLDATKIINWVIFTQAMINISFFKTTVWAYNAEKETINELLKKLRMIKSYTNDEHMSQAREYVKGRIKHFRKEGVAVA